MSVAVRETGLLCGVVARVPDYGYRRPGFDSLRYHVFRAVVDPERGSIQPREDS
jgi:hypothetical protein